MQPKEAAVSLVCQILLRALGLLDSQEALR